MKPVRLIRRVCMCLPAAFLLLWGCMFDDHLREYLSTHFWLPFAKNEENFERANVRRVNLPYAGMERATKDTALGRLRAAYQEIAFQEYPTVAPQTAPAVDLPGLKRAVAAARADHSLSRRDTEEVDLLEAKIELRAAAADDSARLQSAKEKFQAFLRTAQTSEFLSEARGWLARVYYLSGDQTAAGKIYLDELNRTGSNLSRETLLNSLHMNYGYDGGPRLLKHLDEYFDTPEHAAFAIQLVTNPHWNSERTRFKPNDTSAATYARIKGLLARHASLLRSDDGANSLAMLAMRTALRMGDPKGAREIEGTVPANAKIRATPDFNWMSASALFLSRDYAAAERPLLALFRSPRATSSERCAAAYGLCGVYRKTHNTTEQIRHALWLHTATRADRDHWSGPASLADMSVYWPHSGWDLALLLDAEAPLDALQEFVAQNPRVADIGLVKYALAVRLARENRYDESAAIYDAIGASRRAARMRRVGSLYRESKRTDLPEDAAAQAKYAYAEYLSDHPNVVFFNDRLWGGLQRYALQASTDHRLTREERDALEAAERKLKDDQEERWRAYLVLRDVVREEGRTELGRKAAQRAVRCLRGISERFGRRDVIGQADIRMSYWLKH